MGLFVLDLRDSLKIFSYSFFIILFILTLFSLFAPKDAFAIVYGSGQCFDDGGNPCDYTSLSECQDNIGSPNNDCSQNPWTFRYATRCKVCLGGFEPDCNFDYEYDYNNCNTEDRCYGSDTGASGYDPAGRILSGRCSASSYDGSDPNSACISGGQYK